MPNAFRLRPVAALVSLALASLAYPSLAAAAPPQRQAAAVAGLPASAYTTKQMIIKFKPSAGINTAQAMAAPMASTLSTQAGIALDAKRAMSGGAHVYRITAGETHVDNVKAAAQRLMQQNPNILYAEPDYRMFPASVAAPTDTHYADGSQWDLGLSGAFDPATPANFTTTSQGGANLSGAWNITTGDASLVVGVIDTGILAHAELAGRTVAGYDFITNIPMANDADARDLDPADPGDWCDQSNVDDLNSACMSVYGSSWHGTHVAGTIGAASDNGAGITGINWASKIQALRALGKGGGYTSDIADAIRWGAGLTTSDGTNAWSQGTNPTPAKVLNLSLGGASACGATFQNAIDAATGNGAVVVVAAGNEASGLTASPKSPATCSNVITVAALARDGSRAIYSNYDDGVTKYVTLAAPGGDQSDDGSGSPLYGANGGILSTLNDGTTVPGNDSYVYYQGTSMATPHVAGVVSLMLSVNPNLTPAQVKTILQSTARSFTTYWGASYDCTTAKCGAGMLDATAAVQVAQTMMPTTSAGPVAGNVADHGATLTATINEIGTGYWIAVANGAAAPTAAQVKAGVGYAAVAVVAHGSGAMPASTSTDFAIGGLVASTNYDVYFVAEDAASTLQTNPSSAVAVNTTADNTLPTISGVSIPNAAMKVGSVVTATITVGSDTDPADYTLKAGSTIGGFALGSLTKTSATTYTATFTVTDGGTDVAAGAGIPVSVILTDAATNDSLEYTTAISQAGDPIDANKPVISAVTIPDAAMKAGDEVTVTITVTSDTAAYTLKAGATIGGFALGSLAKDSDTSYHATFTVTEGGADVLAEANIPVSLTLVDPAGNESAAYTTAIVQAADAIDANTPATPALSTLAVNGLGGNITIAAPPAGVTAWLAPAGTTVFAFTDGATMTQLVGDGAATAIATPTTEGIYKLYWVDAAGNISVASTNAITVDATPPTSSITAAEFDPAANTLTLTGTNMDTLLGAGENGSTDIKARLDWTKLTWDINGDVATTADKTFVVGDITSVLATSATKLQITLTGGAASALKALAGYGAVDGADKVTVSAGFLRDLADNPATTDAYDSAVAIQPVVTAQPNEWLTADAFGKADAATPMVKFTLQGDGGQTLNTVTVTVAGITGGLQAGDIESLTLATIGNDNVLTPVGTVQTTVAIDGSATTINVGTQAISTATTFAIVAKIKATAPTHGAAFRLDMAIDGIGLSANSPVVTALTSQYKWNIDTAAPTAGSIAVSGMTTTSATLAATLNEAGTGYWVVLPATADAPSVTQVKTGKDSADATATFKGNSAMTANNAVQFSISGLTASTSYNAYFAAADLAGNDIAVATAVIFATSAPAAATSGGSDYSPPAATTTPPVTTTVPPGGSTTVTGSTAVTVSEGSTVVIPAGSASTGATIILPTPPANAAPVPVTITVNGQNLTVTPTAAGTVLGVQTVTVNGVSTQVLSVASGSVSVTASQPGQPLLAVGGGSGSNAIVVTADTAGTAATSTVNAGTGETLIAVSSGVVTLPTNAFAEAGTNGFAANPLAKDGKLYAGEIAVLNSAGKITGVRLGSQSGAAANVGDPIKAASVAGLSITTAVPNLKGKVARVSDSQDFGDVIAASLGATSKGQNSNGVLSLSVSGVNVNALPTGDITVDTSRADGVSTTGNGKVVVVKSGVIASFVPTVADNAQLTGQVIALDKNAGITVNDYGVLQATVYGITYALQPGWVVSQASGGTAGFATDEQGRVVYQDSTGNQQTLYPAFADLAQLVAAFKSSDANVGATGNDDGTVTAKYQGKTYTLTPNYALSPVPAEHAKDAWWLDGSGKVFIKSRDGKTAQGFNVK